MTEVQNLEVLEEQLEQEIQRWENSAIRMGQLLNRIKEGEAYKEAGYRYFQPYYRERWEERIGRTWYTAKTYMNAAHVTAEMEGVGDHLHPVTDYQAAKRLGVIEDPADRVQVWNEYVESGEPRKAGYEHLNARIAEYKGTGVIDQLEERGVEIPPYPEGPTEEEVAYRKFSDLAAVAKDVTPEAAARAISSSTAYSVAPSYDFMLPWVRGFLAELHLRAGR